MNRLPLGELITPKPRPVTTLSLIPAVREHPREMVETYVFTETIRHYFGEILEAVATGQGQGFWVQAEYGAGKTHFLAVLAALLANQREDLWSAVQDDEIRLFRRRLQASHLFPVIVSLRGMGDADALAGRSLLDVILEDGFQPALQEIGLEGQVQVTAADDYVVWLEQQTSAAIRQDVETYVRRQTGRSPQDYRADEGTGALARLIAAYCEQHAIGPKIATSVKHRLAHLYRQLTGLRSPRYNGLLMMIDEYEGWEKAHASPAARAHDEDVLETLAYLLPRDLGYSVYTVVASQSAVPAKLRGGQTGDRFINIPLLASANERDYDVIVSRRVRGLREDRLPEISDHYQYCRQHFDFVQNLTEAEFRDTFPFQPRCFEVVRRITARDLPTARSGISVLYEVVSHPELLSRDMLIRAADLLQSPHLVDDCLVTPVYREAYTAYKVAREALPTLELEAGDMPLARAVLDTLCLWYLAFMERPRPMTLKDLAQATLTTSDFLRAEDNVAYVLGQMQSLRQIQFDNQQASFVPAGGEGISVVTLFNEYRRRAMADTYRVSATWTDSLFLKPQATQGLPGLFSEFTPDVPTARHVEHRHLDYSGQVIVASRWQFDWGLALPKEDVHFRVVILTSEAAQSVSPQDLQDPRIAVVFPAVLSEEATRAAADALAWQKMSEDYAEDRRTGKEAEAVRGWLAGERGKLLANLIQTHLRQYQAGHIVTRDSLAFSARDTFGLPGNDRRIGAIVERLLTAAYPQLPLDWERLRGPLRPAEAGRVFDGYFSRNPSTAETAAIRNYGVALGLSHPEKPDHFAPQQCKALELIAGLLAERRGELPVWRLYEALAGRPYGLPYAVIQLYLLAFVRRGDPKVELLLKRDHKLRTRNGQPLGRDRLTSSNVVDLDFKPGLERAFDSLVIAAGPTWNETVGYAREILDDLRASTDPADAEAQAARLDTALAHLGAEVVSTRDTLKVLQQTLDARLPEEATAALDRLADLATTASSGYPTFYERATATFATPDDLRDTQRTFARLKELARLTAEITATRHYLEDVHLRLTDQELAADRFTLLGRFALDSLVNQPDLWAGLRSEFESFRARYRNTYHKHHRDTQAELTRLQQSLADVPRRLHALALLNSIVELGKPWGEDLESRFQALQPRLQPCPVPFASLALEASPTCPECRLTLTTESPRAEVESFLRDLSLALADQQRRLASEAIRRVLTRSQESAVAKFVQVVQSANLAALVDVMNEDLVTFIRVLLAEEEVGTGESDVLHRFALAYPTLEEADLPAAVQTFENLLREAFTEARKANPDKKTVRLTLK